MLGFSTAKALSGRDVDSWDSGGASFQIVSFDSETGSPRFYNGSLGEAVSTDLFIRNVRKMENVRDYTGINPVSEVEAN